MIRKSLLALAALLLCPAFANAWYVNAKTSPATGQGTISPAGNLSYAAGSNSGEFSVTPAPGYTVSRVTLDGMNIGPNGNGRYVAPYLVGKSWRYLVAYFAAGAVQITTQVTAGSGTIREDNNESLSNIPLGSNRQLLVIPNPGYAIGSVTADGATITDNGNGSKTVAYVNLRSSKSVSASFAPLPVLSVSAGGDVAAYGTGAQFAATLDGSASGNQGAISYSWSGAGLSFGTPNAAVTTVYAASPGSYSATLTASSGSLVRQDSAAVTVHNSAEYQSAVCAGCHTLSTPEVVTAYQGSPHTGRTSCQGCHTPEPHTGVLPSSATCAGCHADGSGNVASHPIAIDANPCLACHNPHSTAAFAGAPEVHYNNVTSAGYPASYMTPRARCADCHYANAANAAIRTQWGASGHAATTDLPWRGQDFKTLSGCVQCHSTTGFIAYSTGRVTAAWGVASDKTKEVLSCVACHSDITTGALRTVAPVQPFADDSYLNRDLGNSNICMACHSGTNNGASIQAQVGSADFSRLPFIAPHYFAAGGILQGQAGYHFPDRTYASYSSNGHRSIGRADSGATASGACIACHMSAPAKHLYQAVTTEATGAITGISTALCANCHAASLGASQLNADQAAFRNALEILKAMLAAKNLVYSGSYPYFDTSNWGSGQAGANTMGAAFNYVLLRSDPGAYAHNPQYAKQLVLDSIDYLDNGQLDDSSSTLGLASLVDSQAVSQAAADSFLAYRAKDSCLTCHGGTAATANPMASGAHPAHLSASYGPGSYLGSTLASCQVCHLYGSASHANGSVNLASGAGSACQKCHAGQVPAWTATGLSCTLCHAAAPAQLPDGVAAPYKGYFASRGHGKFASSNQCADCHDPGSSHISGSLGSDPRLRLANDNSLCASCHNTPSVASAFRNMSTHVTLDGRSLACRDCHDPHGSPNLSMIRSQINGSAIVFTDPDNGLVERVSNRGVCQVCHTQTNFYRAGVPENVHFASSCTGCHGHNTAGGAFRPVGGCDACHGYPPAPKESAVLFGVEGSWVGGRFEDYSGGGGVHLAPGHVPPGAVPGEAWANCSVCHNAGNQGSSYHKLTTPVKSHIDNVTVLVDPKLRFADGFIVYTGASLVNPPEKNATGSCYNVSCHMSPTPRLWGQGGAQYTVTCDFCHRMAPLDSPSGAREPATGAVKGNHQGHAGSSAASCVKCHDSAVAYYGTSHRNKAIEMRGNINDSATAALYSRGFFNQTSVPPETLGSCSNVNCHFESPTPPWGSAAYVAPADCSRCHAVAPASGNHPVAGSKHASYYGTGVASCQKCHPDHAAAAKPFAHATSAAHRGISVRFSTAPNSGGSYSGNGLGFLPSQHKAVFGSCSNLYCHSNGAGGAANVTPIWGGSLDCTGCHNSTASSGAPMTSGRHAAHVDNAATLGGNYGCVACHAGTVSADTTLAGVARHVNGFADYSGAKAGKSYNPGTGVCSSVYCHSDGKGQYRDMALSNWKSSVSLDCRGCHGADAAPAFSSAAGEPNYANAGAGQRRANSHQAHVSAAGDCINCHAGSVDGSGKLAGNGHINGAINVQLNAGSAGPAATWSAGNSTCSGVACHSDGTSIVTGQPAGGTMVWGASLSCDGCHGYPPAYANKAPKANSHASHSYSCSTCHAGTTSDGSSIADVSRHGNRAYDVTPGAGRSFSYTFAASGGSCSNISCHGGGVATWGGAVTWGTLENHNATLGSGFIVMGMNNADHGDSDSFGIEKECSQCHYANLATQHRNMCSLCHGGGNPGAMLGGPWNGTCQQGACHPTFHNEMAPDHNGVYWDSSSACNACHDDSTGDWPGSGDNCSRCHDPAQTAAAVGN